MPYEWGYSWGYTPSKAAQLMSAMVGMPVKLIYGDCFLLKKKDDGSIDCTVPFTTHISDTEFTHLLSAALRCKYSTVFNVEGVAREKCLQLGLSEEAAKSVAEFYSAWESARVENIGRAKWPGLNDMLNEGYDNELWKLVNALSNMDAAKRNPDVFRSLMFQLMSRFMMPLSVENDNRAMDKWHKEHHNCDNYHLQLRSQMFNNFGAASQYFYDHVNDVDKFCSDHGNKEIPKVCERVRSSSTSQDGFMIAGPMLQRYVDLLPPAQKKEAQERLKDIFSGMSGMSDSEAQQLEEEANARDEREREEKRKSKGLFDSLDDGDGGNIKSAMTGESMKGGGKGWKVGAGGGRGAVSFDTSDANDVVKRLKDTLEKIKTWRENEDELSGLRRGKLDCRRVVEICIGNENVFKRTEAYEFNDDITVSLSIDLSGSMYGGGVESSSAGKAINAALGIRKALKEIGKPTDIFPYSSQQLTPIRHSSAASLEEMALAAYNEGGGGTSPVQATQSAVDAVKAASEKTKIVFMLTDGGFAWYDEETLAEMFKKNKDIDFYLFSIGCNPTEAMTTALGSRAMRFDNVRDLPAEFAKILDAKLLNKN